MSGWGSDRLGGRIYYARRYFGADRHRFDARVGIGVALDKFDLPG